MDTKKLRQKILDLAIRGNLVPQDPNDEPASVLLKRIRAEKERLIKEGKIKRSKNSASDDEIEAPFEIPESWEWVRLDDFVMAVTDGDHQPPPQSTTGVPFLVISDVNKGFIDFSHARFVSEEYYNNLPTIRQATKGDILFTVTGSYGIPILVDTEQIFCFQRHIGLIKTISCSEWLKVVLYSTYVHKYCDKVATGTAQKTVSLGHLRNLAIPIPPLAEQQHIVNEVERWFVLIDALESNEDDLSKAIDKAKSKILDLAIHGKLVPQDPNDEPAIELLKRINPKFVPCEAPNEHIQIPIGWVNASIKDCRIEVLNGFAFQSSKYTTTGIRIIRITNVQDGFIEDEAPKYYPLSSLIEIEKYALKADDLLISLTGNVGRVGFLPKSLLPAALNQRVGCIRIKENSISVKYLYYLLLSNKFKKDCVASGKGVAQLNISTEWLKSYIIPLPPFQEQLRIVAKIEELFAVLDGIKESLE